MTPAPATCSDCGKPLSGRDRFERKCAPCREKEALGEADASRPAESSPEPTVACPACDAPNPRGSASCSECGARLRRSGRAAVLAAGGFAGAVGIVLLVVHVTSQPPPKPRSSPRPEAPSQASPAEGQEAPAAEDPQPRRGEPTPRYLLEACRAETRALVGFLAEGRYTRVVDNYVQPDVEDFRRVQEALGRILSDEHAEALSRWQSLLKNAGRDVAVERLRERDAPFPGYTVALLDLLRTDPRASASHVHREDRARAVLAWHLAGLYEGVELEAAQMRLEDLGDKHILAHLQCPGETAAPPSGDDPRRLRWVRRPDAWVLKLSVADRLEDFAQTLAQPVPALASPAP
ncbi:MAG: hypothetical protein ACLF0G_01545 [Candidatus Brocadiia bacterium]